MKGRTGSSGGGERAACRPRWPKEGRCIVGYGPAIWPTGNPRVSSQECCSKLARRGRERLVDDPLAEAAFRETFGSSYAALKLHRDAQLQFEQALANVPARRVGRTDPHSLAAAGALARSLSWQGRYDEAASVAPTHWLKYCDRRRLLILRRGPSQRRWPSTTTSKVQFAASKALSGAVHRPLGEQDRQD